MAITIEQNESLFRLRTAHTEYQMAVDRIGVLRHLWYGAPVGVWMDHLQVYPDVGFSGSPCEVLGDRTYSLDTLPQEYSCAGTCDYRTPALAVRRERDGGSGAALRYQSCRVEKGKYAIPGLPASYAAEDEAATLSIVLADAGLGLTVTLQYAVFPEMDVIARSVTLENEGADVLVLEKAASLCLELPRGNWEWMHFHGRHAMERMPERAPLLHGVQISGSRRGMSSHQQNPAVILCAPDCTETAGRCVGAALVYSGCFAAETELDQLDQARLVMGIHPELFRWRLAPGERFHAPEALLSYSGAGLEVLSHRFHAFMRRHICRGKFQYAPRGVLINNWEATYFHFDEEKLCAIAAGAAEMGAELLVLDDGWFGKREDDCTGLGDWVVNRQKLPGGLDGLARRLEGYGMRLGLWVEPEMISEDSDLYRAHPDWALEVPGRGAVRGRSQLVLDMSRQDVQDYLFEAIAGVLRSAPIAYVKWDMNRSMCDWYSAQLPPERMGELPHRHILGVYALMERFMAAFPDLLFEGCSGGGGRFDAGMLCYFPQIWCSDDTDACERTRIQYGTSFFYPVSAVGAHVSAVPNHQTGRVTPLDTRAAVAMAGSFGYELDPARLTQEEKQAARRHAEHYRALQPLIHGGLYYRLSDPLRENLALWEFVSPDRTRALVQGVVFRAVPNALQPLCRPRGLDEARLYRVNGGERLFTGAALMEGGVLLPRMWGDNTPVEIEITAAEA